MTRINVPVFVIGWLWAIYSTAAFGWNLVPQSTAEIFSDAIAFVLYAAAFAFPPRNETVITLHVARDGTVKEL